MGKKCSIERRLSHIVSRIPQPQDPFVALTAVIALGSGSIAIDLQDIPNQPVRFMVNRLVIDFPM